MIHLTVAVSEPTNVFLLDEIERISECKVQIVCATAKDIKATLQVYMPATERFCHRRHHRREGA